jgi:hypothetical protein
MKRLILSAAAIGIGVGCSGGPRIHVDDASSARSHLAEGGDLTRARLNPDVCNGIDLAPEHGMVDVSALVAFLNAQGAKATAERARRDLAYVDVAGAGTREPVRLRVAMLGSAEDAGPELHDALRQHGKGSWGARRGNVAVLGPLMDGPDDALAFAVRTKIACWGVLTIELADDAYAVGGGYSEP